MNLCVAEASVPKFVSSTLFPFASYETERMSRAAPPPGAESDTSCLTSLTGPANSSRPLTSVCAPAVAFQTRPRMKTVRTLLMASHFRSEVAREADDRVRARRVDARAHRAVVPVEDVFEDEGQARPLAEPPAAAEVERGLNFPSSNRIASGSMISFCSARFSGRAPN